MTDNPHPRQQQPRSAAKAGWGAVLLIVVAAAVWLFGVQEFDALLGIDTRCEDGPRAARGAELAETLRCSLEAGAAGWFYIAWLATFPFLLVTWLERRLRKAMLARRKITPRD